MSEKETACLRDITETDIMEYMQVEHPHNEKELWKMKHATPARIGIGRCGARYTTEAQLRFLAAHAAANDAEAPAEAEEAEDAAVTTDTPADSVETWTIGPLTLGMTGDEIQDILGAPDLESNSGPVEETDGSLRVCWFYQIDNAPGQLYSVKLDLADFGDGWRLDEVTVWPNVEWKTAEGIGIGSTEDEVRAAYPDAERKDSTLVQDDVEIPRTFFTIGEGRTKLWIMVRDGKVAYLDLGTFFEEPPFEVE